MSPSSRAIQQPASVPWPVDPLPQRPSGHTACPMIGSQKRLRGAFVLQLANKVLAATRKEV